MPLETARRILRNEKDSIYLYSVLTLVFLAIGVVMGLPGADGDATSTYNVIIKLAEEQRYTLSRRPGQPVLDYLDFITWRGGGDIGVQLWFALVSAAGTTALYQFLRSAKAAAPLLGALAVGLHPLFLAHVGGLGDFAVSLSFLMLALRAGQLGFPSLAGVLVGMCSGCRMPYLIFAIPVAALAQTGPGVWQRRLRTFLWAGVVGVLAYAPLLASWGLGLMPNFPMKDLGYNVSAFFFRLLISFGVPFWLLVGLLMLAVLRRSAPRGFKPTQTDLAAGLLVALGVLILFRVPTKPELSLPILLGITIFLTVRRGKIVSLGLLACTVLSGVVLLSPYYRDSGRHRWHLEEGHYFKAIEQASDNRLMARTVPQALNRLPEGAVLLETVQWTALQARVAQIQKVDDFDGIPDLTGFRFGAVSGNRFLVSFQEEKLKDLLERRRAVPRGGVYYDSRLGGMLRRWMSIEISQYARPVVMGGQPLHELLSVAGLSSAKAIAGRD